MPNSLFLHVADPIAEYAVFMLDPCGVILTWNQGAERIKGWGREEIIGKHFSCLYERTDIKDGRPERLLRIARTEGHALDEGWRVRKDGTRFWASVAITAMRTDSGDVAGYCKITRDLSDQKRSQAELDLANQRLRTRIADLEHALASPPETRGLLPICAWCQKVRDKDDAWLPVATYVEAHTDIRFTHGICPECQSSARN